MFGFGYVIRYAIDSLEDRNKLEAYRVYCTDCLLMIAQNTGKAVGVEVKAQRYFDIVKSANNTDNRTSDEIISDMKNKLNQFGGEDNG